MKPELYLSDQEYVKRYKEGRLKNNVVDPDVVAGKI